MSQIDIFLIVGFLLINLLAVISYGANVVNLKEYALGNRNFATSTIAITIVATWITGSSLSVDATQTYTLGLSYILSAMGSILVFWVLGYYFLPYMGEFLGKISIAEAMGEMYGKEVRFITVICGLLFSIGVSATQYQIATLMFSQFSGLSKIASTYAIGFVITIYTCYGGIKAIAFTDILQVFTFGVFLPSLCFHLWQGIEGTNVLSNLFTNNDLFDIGTVLSWHNPDLLASLSLFIYFIIPDFNPAIFQRISIAKNIKQSQQSLYLACTICALINICTCGAGALLFVTNPSLETNNLLTYLISNCLYPGLVGLTVIGLLAMLMSTADSYINAAAVLVSYDLCQIFNIKLKNKYQLLLARLCSVAVSVGGLTLSLQSNDILDIFFISASIYSIVTTTFLFAVLGFRTSKKAILVSMFVDVVALIVWIIFFDHETKVNCFIFSFFFNSASLFVSHKFIAHRKWPGIKDPEAFNEVRIARKSKPQEFVNNVMNFNLNKFCGRYAPKEQKTYSYCAFVAMITIFTAIHSLSPDILLRNQCVTNVIQNSVLVIALIFIIYSLIAKHITKYNFMPILWTISVFYILILIPTILSILSGFMQLQVMILVVNIIATLLLFDWRMSLIMGVMSIAIGFNIAYMTIDFGLHDINNNIMNFSFLYLLLTLMGALIALINPKYQLAEKALLMNKVLATRNKMQTEELIEQILRSAQFNSRFVQKMLVKTLGIIQENAEIYSVLKKNDSLIANDASHVKQFLESYNNISETIYKIIRVTNNENSQLKLMVSEVEIISEIRSVIEEITSLHIKDLLVDINASYGVKEIIINCDQSYIRYIVKQLILSSSVFNDYCDHISIDIKKSHLNFNLNELGIKRVEAIKISIVTNGHMSEYQIDNMFKFDIEKAKKNSSHNLSLAMCSSVINSHYGKIWVQNTDDHKIQFNIIIPVDLHKIRPKKLDNILSKTFNSQVIAKLFVELETNLGSEAAKDMIKKFL